MHISKRYLRGSVLPYFIFRYLLYEYFMCLKACIEFLLFLLLQIMTLLEDESMTVEDCGIEENQSILIEGRFSLKCSLMYIVSLKVL